MRKWKRGIDVFSLRVPVIIWLLASGCGGRDRRLDVRHSSRSSEYDRLSMLCGEWDAEFTSTIIETGEALHGTARASAKWGLDGRFIVEHTRQRLDRFGESSSHAMWTWDASASFYRIWRFSSTGGVSEGTATYSEADRTWMLTDESIDLTTGETTHGTGTLRYLADSEKVYHWSVRDSTGRELYHVKGRSRRLSKPAAAHFSTTNLETRPDGSDSH